MPADLVLAVLTYRRPADLAELLPELDRQAAGAALGVQILVVDNDPDGAGRPACEGAGLDRVRYVHEPRPGIAAARNRALAEGAGHRLLAFIDDDERPRPGWLAGLLATLAEHGGPGAVGPVVSRFAAQLSPWVLAGGFFDRRRMPTGTPVTVAATNNLLLDLDVVRAAGLDFDERFGLSGGSDTLFTRRLVRAGGPLIWCDEAVVTDVVPAARCRRDWVLRRAAAQRELRQPHRGGAGRSGRPAGGPGPDGRARRGPGGRRWRAAPPRRADRGPAAPGPRREGAGPRRRDAERGRRVHVRRVPPVTVAMNRWRRRLAVAATVLVVLAGTGLAVGGARRQPAVPGAAASDLDPTGRTVPRTEHPVPPGAVVMSPSGSDAAAGTRAAPVRSLARAYVLVRSGGTVVARGGTYRDGDLEATRPFMLQAYPGEQPWFDGTDVVTGWQPDGAGHWWVDWSTPDFCRSPQFPAGGYQAQAWPWTGVPGPDGPCIHPDMVRDPQNPAAADPQMAFRDGRPLPQVTALADLDLRPGAFFYDSGTHRLSLGADPTGATVELARRPVALVIRTSDPGAAVRGIGFRRYATNQKHEGSLTHGALAVVGSPRVLVEDSVFTGNAAAGATFVGAPPDARIAHSVFAANGFNGLDANGGRQRDNFTITASVLAGNNTELFGLGCTVSCSAAAAKLAHMHGLSVTGSIFADSRGAASGLWCDLDCTDAVITRNVFSGNGNVGLFYEVSDTGLIASNQVTGNGRYLADRRPDGTAADPSDRGAGIRVSSARTVLYDNTVSGNSTSLVIYDDARSPGAGCAGCRPRDVGPDTRDVQLIGNVITGGCPPGPAVVVFDRTPEPGVPGTGPAQQLSRVVDNTYRIPPGAALYRVGGRSFAGLDALRAATGWERGSRLVVTGRCR